MMYPRDRRPFNARLKAVSAMVGASAVGATALFVMLGTGGQAAASPRIDPPAQTVSSTAQTTLKIAFATPTYTATPCAKRATMPC
jgi:hypothetical protein